MLISESFPISGLLMSPPLQQLGLFTFQFCLGWHCVTLIYTLNTNGLQHFHVLACHPDTFFGDLSVKTFKLG